MAVGLILSEAYPQIDYQKDWNDQTAWLAEGHLHIERLPWGSGVNLISLLMMEQEGVLMAHRVAYTEDCLTAGHPSLGPSYSVM